MILAILLANGPLTSIRSSHDPAGAPLRAVCVVVGLAPIISERRSVGSPLEMFGPVAPCLLKIAEEASDKARLQSPVHS
jgi:hypothetical protein